MNEIDGEIVSSCVCVIILNLTRGIRPYAFVENVVTHKDYRGKGCATDCLQYAKEIAMRNTAVVSGILSGCFLLRAAGDRGCRQAADPDESPTEAAGCRRRPACQAAAFLVSLLKHEAQHTVDMKQFPGITPAELEYRAKLVELHYASDLGLLQKFLSEADEIRANDSHAVASAKLKLEFADTDQTILSGIQTQALKLLHAHTKEMEETYGKQKTASDG